MSIYGRRKNNLFLGYFSDLAELQAAYPSGEDGQFAGVNDVKKKYYWDISSRSWEDSGEKYNGDFSGTVDLGNVGILSSDDTRIDPKTGFKIPPYNTKIIDVSAAPATTTITYKLGLITVATETIAVSGDITTISITY